ncbi:MAG TPA: ABC transporter substrate-binding protein [Candidatus Lustribacter sp.]
MKPYHIDRRTAVAALAGAFAAPLLGRAALGQDVPLRLATAPLDVSAQPYYALKYGFFKRAGLTNVTLETMATGAAMAVAVAGGAIDIAVNNIVGLAQAYERGVPFTMIAAAGLYSSNAPTSVLMVRNDSPLKTAADLNGKTLGASGLRGVAQFAPMAWVDQHGGQSSTLKFVELTVPEMLAAIPSGKIDAGLIIEPYIAEAKKTMRVFADCFDAIAPTFIISAHFCNLGWARTHPDTVKRYAEAMRITAEWANAHHDQSAQVLIDIAHLKPDVVKTMTRSVYGDKLDPAQIQPVIDVTAKYTGAPTFPATKLIFSG